MADKVSTTVTTPTTPATGVSASTSNPAISLPNLGVTVSGDGDLDTRLDRLEAFAKATDDKLGGMASDLSEERELARGAADAVAGFEARVSEIDARAGTLEDNTGKLRREFDKSFAELKPDELNAKLDKIENDNAAILARPAFDPTTFANATGAYTEPSDNFPRGLLAYIVETYHRADVIAYNRDLAATADRKAREAAASGS